MRYLLLSLLLPLCVHAAEIKSSDGALTVQTLITPSITLNGVNQTSWPSGTDSTAVNLSGTEIDLGSSTRVFSKSLGADTEFTFANLSDGQRWWVVLTNGASWTVTWPTVTWMSGSAPVMDTGAGVVNVFAFMRQSGVTFGDVSQQKITAGLPTDPGAKLVVGLDGSLSWASARNYIEIYDEFAGSVIAGAVGWASVASGGAAGIWGDVIANQYFGCAYLDSGDAAAEYGLFRGNGSMTYFGLGRTYYETRVQLLGGVSSDAQAFTFTAGFSDNSTSTNAAEGVFFSYVHSQNDAKWTACTADNSSLTTNTVWSGTVAASTWYRLGFDINAAGTSAVFYVDGTAIATNTTNIPITSSRSTTPQFHIYRHAGTSTRRVLVDYVRILQWITTTR